jgi:lycopene elongase/hydratase (dihydrobisanhydrobacterioruberin-forming)
VIAGGAGVPSVKDMARLLQDLRPAPRRETYTWAIVRLTRPWFWPLGWAGAYVGAVLATGAWFPPAGTALDGVLALVVLGPLVWGAVLAVNDLHDLPSDRRNPRKATAPLVTGVLSAADVAQFGRVAAVAAIVVAIAVGPVFAVGTGLVLLLGWLYSAPPARLKARPGADVLVNAAVVGVLGPLAGWSLHRPIGDYPPMMVLLGLLVAAALYVPTTVMDVDADRVAGDATAAVRWTPYACRRLGLALWIAAVAVWLACCHGEVLVARESWPVQDAMAPVLVVVYAAMTRRPSIPRMAVVALTFGVTALDFMVAVTR